MDTDPATTTHVNNTEDALVEFLIEGYITVRRTANGLGESFFGFSR